MARTFGPLCPDGHGLLLDAPGWGGRRFCPHAAHGGNGRFFHGAEIKEGWWDDRQTPTPDTSVSPSGIPLGRVREQVKEARATRRGPVDGQGPECLCGCGERTKGGRFRPGHDARYHAALKKGAVTS